MASGSLKAAAGQLARAVRKAALAGTVGMLGACAQSGGSENLIQSISGPPLATGSTAAASGSDLQQATDYWGRQFAAKPADATTAVAYARNLKAMGEKDQALAVLQQAHMLNPRDRAVNSEYGRLALEQDQISVAEKLLQQADDPANPDWRVISARGVVLARQGDLKGARALFQRALALAPGQPSVLNNMALVHTMDGEAQQGELLLRQAAGYADADPKVAQNLALVLGLQGKYDESRQVVASVMAADAAAANADFLRQMVRLEQPRAGQMPPQAPAAIGAKSIAAAGTVPAADRQLAEAVLAEARAEAAKRAAAQLKLAARPKPPAAIALKPTAEPAAEASDFLLAASAGTPALLQRPSTR